MTASDLLRAYAQFAENAPLHTLSPGGAEFQKAFVAFLRANADARPDHLDMLTDLFVLVARFMLEISMAGHGGTACPGCIAAQCNELCLAIGEEMLAQFASQSQNPKGTH